jgi:hypothetical protein
MPELVREYCPRQRIAAIDNRKFHYVTKRQRLSVGNLGFKHIGFQEAHDVIERILKCGEQACEDQRYLLAVELRPKEAFTKVAEFTSD